LLRRELGAPARPSLPGVGKSLAHGVLVEAHAVTLVSVGEVIALTDRVFDRRPRRHHE